MRPPAAIPKTFGRIAAPVGLALLLLLQLPAARDARAGDDLVGVPTWLDPVLRAVVGPADRQPGDHALEWAAPNGSSVRVVVRHPRREPRQARVTVSPPADGKEAGPSIERALADVRAAGGGTVVLQPGQYRFETVDRKRRCHLCVTDLHDVAIEGPGAELVMGTDADGIVVSGSQRVRLAGVTVRYAVRTSSLARVVERDHDKLLEVPDAASSSDAVHQVVEFDRAAGRWVQGGQRLLFPPGEVPLPTAAGPHLYASPSFRRLDAGKTFTVQHHWYGGAAIKAADEPGPTENEDIVLDGVKVRNAPGMGVIAYGVRRGFAVLNSEIGPGGASCAGISTEYDGIHIQQAGGDVLLARNRIACMGDDGINVSGPVQPVVSVDDAGTELVLGRYSRFIRSGDTLAFFDRQNNWLGSAQAAGDPKPVSGLQHRVRISQPVKGIDSRTLVRDLALATNRYAVVDNEIGPCACNGILAQAPNGLLRGNTIRRASHAGIKLLGSTGGFQEGTGAVNVRVAGNTVVDSGAGRDLRLDGGEWGAINVYGLGSTGLHRAITNWDIAIADNRVENTSQACIVVASSQRVRVSGNTCSETNLAREGNGIRVVASEDVALSGNVRKGSRSGPLGVDAATTRLVTGRSGY